MLHAGMGVGVCSLKVAMDQVAHNVTMATFVQREMNAWEGEIVTHTAVAEAPDASLSTKSPSPQKSA